MQRGERETESKRANEMAAEDTETERNEGEIEKEGGRDANPDRLMIVPPAATGRMAAQLWHFPTCVGRPSFPTRSRVQITSLKSPNG